MDKQEEQNEWYLQSQYGEAMICPDDKCKIMLGAEPCPHRNPHICENKGIITSEPPIGMGCPDCIPCYGITMRS